MNLEDEKKRLLEEQTQQVQKSNITYNTMANENQSLLQSQQNLLSQQEQLQKDTAESQLETSQKAIDLAKSEATETYQEETRQAKTDYNQFVNPYGVQAEQEATQGKTGTGYSETVKGLAYSSAQNRIATAKTNKEKIISEYNLQMEQARQTSNIELAQYSLQILQQKLANETNSLNTKQAIEQKKLASEQTLNQEYSAKLDNIYKLDLAEQERQEAIKQWEQEFAFEKQQLEQDKLEAERDYELSQLALKQEKEESIRDYNLNMYKAKQSTVLSYPPLTDNTQTLTEDKVVTSSMTPRLSTKTASTWFYNNIDKPAFDNKGMKTSEITNKLATAYNNKTINDSDVKAILNVFGLE